MNNKKITKDVSCSVGVIKKVITTDKGIVRYLINFNDDSGRKRFFLSNWTENTSRKEGGSIPVKFVYVPYTFRKKLIVIEVDNLPQYNDNIKAIGQATMITSIAAASLIVGWLLGKRFTKNG